MAQSATAAAAPPLTQEEIQNGWHDLRLRVEQLEAEKVTLEQENKSLRTLLERSIEYRQKSHSELVLLLTGLVSKLPMNDVGVIVSRLVEHNTNVSQYLSALTKGAIEGNLNFQPAVLKTLEETKRELRAELKPMVEDLIRLDTPLEKELLQSWIADPETFFTPHATRANRCFIKGLVTRERILKEFGPEALAFFNDLTTDPKLNPHPKPEEIFLCFRSDFESLLQQNTTIPESKRGELLELYRKIHQSKASSEQARQQKSTFQKASFIIELLHYYDNQNTEAPDVIFAQRLPALIEQMVSTSSNGKLEPKLVEEVEGLLGLVIHPDHGHMIVNNLGKSGGDTRALKYVLKLRTEKLAEPDVVATEFVKHLIPTAPQKPPGPTAVADILRLLRLPEQKLVARQILNSDRLRKSDAETLVKAVGEALGVADLGKQAKEALAVPPEVEQRLAWDKIKDMIAHRTDATTVAAAIRDRLNAKYNADEIRQSWLVLTEADPISLIRIFSHLPYRSDGKTDAIARPVIETYVSRLLHEKYAGTYKRVVTSLKNMYSAKPDSPTLVTFLALVRWVDPAAANKISADVGMPVPA